jgi:hypothetical protein
MRSYGLHTSKIELKKFIHERLAGRGVAAEILRKLPQLEDKDALLTIICLLDGKMVIYTPAPGNALLSFKYDQQELLDGIEKVLVLRQSLWEDGSNWKPRNWRPDQRTLASSISSPDSLSNFAT